MRFAILPTLLLTLTSVACDAPDDAVDSRAAVASPADLDLVLEAHTRDDGLVDMLDLAADLDPAGGGSCKFSSDSKSCGMVCATFGTTCALRGGVAECQICTPAGCSSFQTDGCDPTTWP